MDKGLSENYEIYYYISSLANSFTPAKTIYVCAPDRYAHSYESAGEFARNSGWISLVEEDGAVLVMPIVKDGWHSENPRMISELYEETRKGFKSKNGDSIPGRDGFIWCWETLVYLVGYEEGAVFAGNVTVVTPNRFAGVALINGVPSDYSARLKPSDHWLVKKVSSDYVTKNEEVPVCLWMFAENEKITEEALAYFIKSNQIKAGPEQLIYDGIDTKCYINEIEEAAQIRISIGHFAASPALARTIIKNFFNNFIRWKNAPDGTLKPYLNREAFYNSNRYLHDKVIMNHNEYEYHTYLPEGMTTEDAAELPVVFSVHGRGEPAWIFATKNGWEKLADETKEFVLVLPDSPQNIWLLERDGEVFKVIIDQLYRSYGIDKTRVYLTGFSNGGMITRQVGNHYPELFAAISPWNAPFADNFQEILASGHELPCFIYIGDNDEKVPLWENVDSLLENMLKINNCKIKEVESRNPLKFIPDDMHDKDNYYTNENGYTEGERFHTYIYNNFEGHARVCFTMMKNMPHGAIYDQSRAAWAFLKRFHRPAQSKKVVEDR